MLLPKEKMAFRFSGVPLCISHRFVQSFWTSAVQIIIRCHHVYQIPFLAVSRVNRYLLLFFPAGGGTEGAAAVQDESGSSAIRKCRRQEHVRGTSQMTPAYFFLLHVGKFSRELAPKVCISLVPSHGALAKSSCRGRYSDPTFKCWHYRSCI